MTGEPCDHQPRPTAPRSTAPCLTGNHAGARIRLRRVCLGPSQLRLSGALGLSFRQQIVNLLKSLAPPETT